jgi:raffinose/stachyose/melibiose transport system substrate-binding protein
VEDVTLRVLVHQNPPMVEFMESFNDQFEAANPGVTIDMSVVAASDLSLATQTRLSANDIDVFDIFGFSNAAQPYMSDVTPPNWQTLIEAGLLMDLTGQSFVDNYDTASIADAGSVDGKVYSINLGRVSYSGMFVNEDLFAANGIDVPTTWSELVAACDAFKAAGASCMTAGGADGWPIFVGAYGLLGSMYPDQAALVEGLWTGDITWDDEKSVEMLSRMQIYANDMLEEGVTGLSHDAAPARFAVGDVAMMPTGVWQAPALDGVEFEWSYIPFPGSDNPEDNQYLFGKYDQGWAIANDTPNKDAALGYLAAFSEPSNYQDFVNAVGFIPTQPTASLETKLGEEVAPYLENYRVGFEQYWVAPKGVGQWANASQAAAWFQPFNEWGDPAALAAQAQADLQSGLGTAPVEDVTLRVLVHQNPPMVEFMESFNDQFEAANPGVTIDMSVVAASDLSLATQTRLSANDIDVFDIFGFSNAAQPYMSDVTPPNWQTLIEAGLLMDLTGQSFVDNYDTASIADAGSVDGKVYSINLGRVSYSGMFVNEDLFAANGIDVPTTWSELVAACDAFKAAGASCMTAGGADGWPIFVGAYGLLGSMYPDQAALVEGLWTGDITWDDEKSVEMLSRMQIYANDMLEEGVTGLSHDAAPARFAVGDVAMMPTGVWQAPALDGVEFEWSYIPFPGSDNPEDNQYLFGKYDQGWAIANDTPNKDAALGYLAAFSEPSNYQDFVNAVGFIPTQPTASLETKLGEEVAPYLENYRVGFEQYWVAPKGVGQWANASQAAAWFQPFNEWGDPAALAAQAQADLQSGLAAGS